MGIKKASLTEIYCFIHNNKVESLSDTLLIHIGYGHGYADHLFGSVYLVAMVKEGVGLTYATINDIKANKYIGEIADLGIMKSIFKPIKLDGHLNPPVFFKGIGFMSAEDSDVMSIIKSYNVKSFVKWKQDIMRADFDYTN